MKLIFHNSFNTFNLHSLLKMCDEARHRYKALEARHRFNVLEARHRFNVLEARQGIDNILLKLFLATTQSVFILPYKHHVCL